MGMIRILPDLEADEKLLTFSMVQSGGPGGQNVNKVATAVKLRFRFSECEALNEGMKARIREAYAGRINSLGELTLVSRKYRTQEQNRTAVLRRLGGLLEAVRYKPAPRIPTKAPKTSKGGGGPSGRRESPKRIRYFDPEEWENL